MLVILGVLAMYLSNWRFRRLSRQKVPTVCVSCRGQGWLEEHERSLRFDGDGFVDGTVAKPALSSVWRHRGDPPLTRRVRGGRRNLTGSPAVCQCCGFERRVQLFSIRTWMSSARLRHAVALPPHPSQLGESGHHRRSHNARPCRRGGQPFTLHICLPRVAETTGGALLSISVNEFRARYQARARYDRRAESMVRRGRNVTTLSSSRLL
jgi:hypothetical protein